MAGPVDRFDADARRALALAQAEAIRFHHDYIGPEHLLLGVLRDGHSVGARALTSLGVEVVKARKSVELIDGRGDESLQPAKIVLLPESKRVIEFAADEAEKLGEARVGPEHVLLAILRYPGKAEAVLQGLGVSLDAVRQKVLGNSVS
jgi:ATP-dependent Clp protease ATP-binding subunit ClpC